MAGWANSFALFQDEAVTMLDLGATIPEDLRTAAAALDPEADAWNQAAIDPLHDALQALPISAELAAAEPDDLAAIKALRPAGPRNLGWQPSPETLQDRLHGAWALRSAGCALGKPVEGMGMDASNGVGNGRDRIKAYLSRRGHWPLTDYFSGRQLENQAPGAAASVAPGGLARGLPPAPQPLPPGAPIPEDLPLYIGCKASQREAIAFAEADDDLHYSLIGLGVLERQGPSFTWKDVARFWTGYMPFGFICTAETQAVLNYWNRSTRGSGPGVVACDPAWTRSYRNPYREWIGAQIRADGWAWACAGKPELAAEFAYRDACWTHSRNGIYGEMFCAAMIAAAAVEADPSRIIEIGLSEIPAQCRLAQAVRGLLAAWPGCAGDWERAMTWIEAHCAVVSPWHRGRGRWNHGMSPVHTINNALIVVLSLLAAGHDEVRTPAIAVMCGLDTDCNGATAGSISGMVLGRSGLGGALVDRLNDEMRPCLIGFERSSFTDLARRTAVVWQQVDTYARDRA